MKVALIETSKGTLEAELYEKDAPATVKNFCELVEKGFYNGLIFHKVVPDFIVQTGCPKGDGTGGPGYFIRCELNGKQQQHDEGVLSMANSGRNTGGSQFFICLNRRSCASLDGNHTCFGRLTRGLEILDNIEVGDRIRRISISEAKPKEKGKK